MCKSFHSSHHLLTKNIAAPVGSFEIFYNRFYIIHVRDWLPVLKLIRPKKFDTPTSVSVTSLLLYAYNTLYASREIVVVCIFVPASTASYIYNIPYYFRVKSAIFRTTIIFQVAEQTPKCWKNAWLLHAKCSLAIKQVVSARPDLLLICSYTSLPNLLCSCRLK